MLYHIDVNGSPAPCDATKRACPRGSRDEHYERPEQAAAAYETRMSEQTLPALQKSQKITLSSNLGEAEVINGDLSDSNARTLLSSGLCGDLALNIHEKTGAPIVFAMYQNLSEEKFAEEFAKNPNIVFQAQHVMVKSLHHENSYVDSYGVKTFEEIDEFYGGVTMIEGSTAMGKTFAGEDYQQFSQFADTAIKLDAAGESYDYDEMDEYSDEYDDEYEDEDGE